MKGFAAALAARWRGLVGRAGRPPGAAPADGQGPRFHHVPLDRELKPDLSCIPDLKPGDRDAWLVFAPGGSELNPRLERIVADLAWRRPDADLVYGDETVRRGAEPEVVLKPALNPALLLAADYVGLPLVVRASAYVQLGGVSDEAGGAACYDLCLRALEEGLGLQRATEVLARHPGPRPTPPLEERRAALERMLARRGGMAEARPGRRPGTFEVRRLFREHPSVTLVVPTRRSAPEKPGGGAAEPFLHSFLRSLPASTWPMERIEVLVGDDLPGEAAYERESRPFRLRRVVTERPAGEPFHYAAKMNRLWRLAETELVVLMNDDLEVRSPDWLEALLTFALDEDVGAVGARLLFPDGTIQHAGIACGPFGTCAHAWFRAPAGAPTYMDWGEVHRDWSAVTGAVLATRRAVLERLNGFDERFGLEFNDVDLCLRLRALGYRVVYTPHAELIHHERASRGSRPPPGDQMNLFVKRWGKVVEDDPMFHPGLARDRFELAPRADLAAWRVRHFGAGP